MLEKGERRLREIEYLKNLAKPITASELGTMFGVCRTTAQQDILALQDWGCEFERRSGNSGGCTQVVRTDGRNFKSNVSEFTVGREKCISP